MLRGGHRRSIKAEEKAKVVTVVWGDVLVLECRWTIHMIWANVFWRTSIVVGWWFDMVWNQWSSIFSKHPFRQVAFILQYSSFSAISSWWRISSAKRNWINPVLQTAVTSFAFSSVFTLLLWWVVGRGWAGDVLSKVYLGAPPDISHLKFPAVIRLEFLGSRCLSNARVFNPFCHSVYGLLSNFCR